MENIKKKIGIKENWKFYTVLICAIITILLLTGYMAKISDKLYKKMGTSDSDEYIDEITQGTVVSQYFTANYDNLEKIYIDFEPFKNESTVGGTVIVGIKDQDGNIIKEEKITRNYVRENTTYKFQFKKQKQSEGNQYELYIKFDDLGQHEKFYTVNVIDEKINENDKLVINGQDNVGSLVFKELYLNRNKTICYTIANIVLVAVVLVISIYLYRTENCKEEKFFLATVPIICLMFMVAMPTFKNHDELYHWIRSYEVSTGVFATKLEDGIEGTELPSAITAIMKSDWTTTSYSDVIYNLRIKLNKLDTYKIDSATSAVYAFIQYIPQAIGIMVARIFTDRPLIMTYAGRLVNIMVSVFLLYKAIKMMPFGKKTLLVLSYIPIVIEGFSSLSPDAMTISMSFFYIAYILNLTFNEEKKVGMKEKVILTVLSAIVALCKIVYLPLILLLFLIPKEKFVTKKVEKNVEETKLVKRKCDKQNRRKILNIIVIGGIAVILNLSWLAFTSRYLANFREGDSKYQVLLLLKNPIEYIAKAIYSINLYGNNYITSMFGEALGWGELVRLNFLVPTIMCILMIIEIVTDNTLRNKFKLYQKVILSLTLLAIIALIFTSLYVQWTTVGSQSILGVQGRYFIPILPLFMLLLGDVIKIKSEYNDKNVLKLISITGLVASILTTLTIIIAHM